MAQPTITSAERIADLTDISSEVPHLLSSASQALDALTGQTRTADSAEASPTANGVSRHRPTLDESKKAFTAHATSYFVTLQAIMARLRRQAYALEEAGIISAERPALSAVAQSSQQQGQAGPGGRINLNRGAGVRRPGPGPAGQQLGRASPSSDEEAEGSVSGGLGSLDVTLLNSRADRGGSEKESEVLGEAQQVLKELLAQVDQDQEMVDGG